MLGAHHSSQLMIGDDTRQQRAPLTDKQLEDFSGQVLGSSSDVWRAEDRSLPASTSYGEDFVNVLVGKLKGVQGRHGVVTALKELTKLGELETIVRGLQELNKADLERVVQR